MERSQTSPAIPDAATAAAAAAPPRSHASPQIALIAGAEQAEEDLISDIIFRPKQTFTRPSAGDRPKTFAGRSTSHQGWGTITPRLAELSIHSSHSTTGFESTSTMPITEDPSTTSPHDAIHNDRKNENTLVLTTSLDLEITNPWIDASAVTTDVPSSFNVSSRDHRLIPSTLSVVILVQQRI